MIDNVFRDLECQIERRHRGRGNDQQHCLADACSTQDQLEDAVGQADGVRTMQVFVEISPERSSSVDPRPESEGDPDQGDKQDDGRSIDDAMEHRMKKSR